MSFELQLVEEKVKRHQVTAMHLTCALAFICGGAIMYIYNYTVPYWGLALLIAGIALLVITMAKNKWAVLPDGSTFLRVAEFLISSAMAAYSIIQRWTFPIEIFSVLSAAILFALFWERTRSTGQYIHIDNEGIKLPVTSRKRFLDWKETETVLLKYGTLSVECTGNRLFQWNIQEVNFTKEDLEQFCSKMVEEHKSRRVVEEW